MSDLQALIDAPTPLTEDGRRYDISGQPYDRVTDIVSKTMPPYLAPWAENTGHAAMFKLLMRDRQQDWTLEQAVDAIRAAGWDCESEKKQGGTRGAEIHFAVEAWIKQGVPPTLEDFEPEHRPFAQTLCQFLIDYEPVFECSELTIWHPELVYAGTIDAIGRATKRPKGVRHVDITGKRLAWDFKTNKEKKVYPQHHAQLAGYHLALQHHQVQVEGTCVVALGPSPWKNSGKPYRVDPGYWRPEQWKPLMALYETLKAAQKQNPNSRAA